MSLNDNALLLDNILDVIELRRSLTHDQGYEKVHEYRSERMSLDRVVRGGQCGMLRRLQGYQGRDRQ